MTDHEGLPPVIRLSQALADSLELETDPVVLRAVVDGVQHCNLRCLYCHPGEVWRQQHLPVERIGAVFTAAEAAGLLEVVISGGEITLHPQFDRVLDAVLRLRRTASTLITNATRVDAEVAELIGTSALTRVCVSVDGADNATHGSARGKNLPRVLAGLRLIRATGKPVTVITVVHRGNWEKVVDLSRWLADEGLADQHHASGPILVFDRRRSRITLLHATELPALLRLAGTHPVGVEA